METTETTETPSEQRPLCKNCGKKMTRKGGFCPHCGQKNFDGRIRMRDLLSKFIFNLTHLDSKFLRMCWRLFIPGQVTIEYFQGKIKRYPHPIQFFFVVMFFFLLALSKLLNGSALQTTREGEGIVFGARDQKIGKAKIINDNFFGALQQYAMGIEMRAAFDSIPPNLRTPTARAALDSVLHIVNGDWELALETLENGVDSNEQVVRKPLDTIDLNFITYKLRIATTDLVRLEPDVIIDKYGIHDWRDKLLLRQGIKSVINPKGLMHNFLGSLTWTFLALVAFMAVLLRCLYWRRGRYYAEHFIFLLHQHSGAFLLLTLAIVLEFFFNLGGIWLLLFLWIGIALLIAMFRFYRQGFLKTFFKWLIYTFLYIFGFTFLFVAGLLVVFALF